MSKEGSRGLIVADSTGDIDQIRDELLTREFKEVLRASRSTEVAQILESGALELAVVAVEEKNGHGIEAIKTLKKARPQLPVIATGPAATPELILEAVRAGAVEFLVRPVGRAEFSEALDRVADKAVRKTSRTTTCAVYSAKGGLGNTTVAVNLAFAAAQLDPENQVALVDLVVQGGDVRVFLDMKPRYTIKDLAEKAEGPSRLAPESLMHACPGRVWVCPDPNFPDEGELLTGRRVAAVVRRLSETFKYTIIDCEHALTERTLAVLDLADKVVLLTHLSIPAVRSLQRTLDLFERLHYPNEKLAIIVNRYGARADLTLSDLSKVVGRPILATLPNDYAAATKAASQGRPLYQVANKSKIASGLTRLAAELNGRPEGANGGKRGRRLLRLFSRAGES